MNTIDTYAILDSTFELRDFLGIEDDNTEEEEILINIINYVSARMETYCDRQFKSRSYTEYYDGHGETFLYLDNYPIITVSGVYDDSAWEWATAISSSTYRNTDRKIILKSSYFGDYDQNVKVVYTAGYATIPKDLVEVCVKECARLYKTKKDLHIFSKTLSDGSIERFQTTWLPESKMVLDKYSNKAII